MARLVAQRETEAVPTLETLPQEQAIDLPKAQGIHREPSTEDEIVYWLTPVRSDDTQTAEEVIQKLIGTEGIYAFSERTPGRKRLKPGDWIAFYATGTGVIAMPKSHLFRSTSHIRVSAIPKPIRGFFASKTFASI